MQGFKDVTAYISPNMTHSVSRLLSSLHSTEQLFFYYVNRAMRTRDILSSYIVVFNDRPTSKINERPTSSDEDEQML